MYRMIIVDDEPTEIKFVRYVVNTFKLPFYICGEGENGEQAIELARTQKADFVILDINMPLMDGLTAASIIKRESPATKVYLLTAYESFAYASQAVKVDVDDYLLKPIRPEQLVEALKKGISEVLRERLADHEISKMKQKVETAKPLLRRQLLLELVTGSNPGGQTLTSMKNVLGLGQIKPAGVLVAMVYDKSGNILSGNWLRETLVRDIEKQGKNGLCELLPSGEIVVLLKSWNAKTQQTFQHTTEVWERFSEVEVYGGYAPINVEGNVPLAYQTAVKVGRTALFWHEPGIFTLPRLGSVQDHLSAIPATGKAVFNLLLERKPEEAKATLRETFYTLHSQFIAHDHALMIANQIVNALLFELAEQLPGKESSAIFQHYQDSAYTSYEQLESGLFDLIEGINRWFSLPNETLTEQYIQWAISYIRQHYQENITLEQLAAKLFLSPSYFSRMFKKHVGEGFASFSTRMRMEHAQNLLATGKLSVAQIAKQVGYYDPGYFSTVYKKHFGLSPQQAINFSGKNK